MPNWRSWPRATNASSANTNSGRTRPKPRRRPDPSLRGRAASIHPARFALAVLLFFGWLLAAAVIAVFVEVHLAVILAHVHLELAGRAAAFPAIVGVTNPEVLLRGRQRQPTTRNHFEVDEAEERAAEMGHIGDAAGVLKCSHQRDEDETDNDVFRLDGERQREHEQLAVAIKNAERHQDAVDPARGTDGQRARSDAKEARVSHAHRTQRGPENTEEKELQEAPAAPVGLELRAKHPQREHVEQQVKKSRMQEGVGDQLPEIAAEHSRRQ